MGTPSSIWVSAAIAILSGRLAEQMIRPEKPPVPAASEPSAGPPVLSPVCAPIIPVSALNGCWSPTPETKPRRGRLSHQRRDSSAGVVLLYAPVTTPSPFPAVAPVQRPVVVPQLPTVTT